MQWEKIKDFGSLRKMMTWKYFKSSLKSKNRKSLDREGLKLEINCLTRHSGRLSSQIERSDYESTFDPERFEFKNR